MHTHGVRTNADGLTRTPTPMPTPAPTCTPTPIMQEKHSIRIPRARLPLARMLPGFEVLESAVNAALPATYEGRPVEFLAGHLLDQTDPNARWSSHTDEDIEFDAWELYEGGEEVEMRVAYSAVLLISGMSTLEIFGFDSPASYGTPGGGFLYPSKWWHRTGISTTDAMKLTLIYGTRVAPISSASLHGADSIADIAHLQGTGTSTPQRVLDSKTQAFTSFHLHRAGTTGDWLWQEYQSHPFLMAAGENLWMKVHLPMPTTHIALRSFRTWVTDAHGDHLIPSRLHQHYWSIANSQYVNPLCPNELPEILLSGIQPLPAGKAISLDGGVGWYSEIHLIRLDGIVGARALRECVECYHAPSKCPAEANGTFACCGRTDGRGLGRTFCPVTMQLPAAEHVLHYRIEYRTELHHVTLVNVGMLSAPTCRASYSILHEDGQPESLASHKLRMPFDATLVFAAAQQRIGAINMTLSVNGKVACVASWAVPSKFTAYAELLDGWQTWLQCTEPATVADDSPMPQQTPTLRLWKGDMLRVDGWYDAGRSGQPHATHSYSGTHLNAVSYMWLAWDCPSCRRHTMVAKDPSYHSAAVSTTVGMNSSAFLASTD